MGDPEFILLGDAIWLDFVNTARTRGRGGDRMPDAAAYHRWAKACRIRSDADLVDHAAVRRFRTRLLRLAEALAGRQPAPSASLALINEFLHQSGGRQQLTREGGAWRLHFAPDEPRPGLLAVAHSAAAALADPLLYVRECAAPGCTLFFSDASLAQDRRWCAEDACGTGGWVERRRGVLG